MSARRKVNGNRAVTCDVAGCSSVYVAGWWGNGAAEARWQAQDRGWTRCLSFGDGDGGGYSRLSDICPTHDTHPPHCSCPRAMDLTTDAVRTEPLSVAEISPACSIAACVDCPGFDLFGKPCSHDCHTAAVTPPSRKTEDARPAMFTIPDTGFTPVDTWALKCDGCGQLVRAFAELEGSGSEGLAHSRALLAGLGWTRSPFSHKDYCPTCTQQEAARTRTREPRDAWGDAHAHAVSVGVADPEQFANDYASMLEDSQYENRYPDVPLPTPAEFIWP